MYKQDKQDEQYRLLSEHLEHDMFHELCKFKELIGTVVERGRIDENEQHLFLALGSYFLSKAAISDSDNAELMSIYGTDLFECGSVPGSDACGECTRVCPFKNE